MVKRLRNVSNEHIAQHVGVSRQSVSRWMAGQVVPSGEYISVLADVLGVSVLWLTNGDGEIPQYVDNLANRIVKLPESAQVVIELMLDELERR